MPFLRFSRDRRGYESTYLCHTYLRSGAAHLRVLYWFRSPPDVKIGRLALDPAAIRAIEECNPDLKFDWDKILKVKPPPVPPERERDGREDRRTRRRRGAGSAPASIPPPLDPIPVAGPVETAESPVAIEPDEELDGPGTEPGSEVWDDLDADSDPEKPAEGPPAHVVLGLTDDQGLVRLRARHAELQVRIGDRFRDPATLEKVFAQASLLDPDAWRTVDEARERLAALEVNTAAIRKVLGRRRRRRRGRPRRDRLPEAGVGVAPAAAPSGADGVPETRVESHVGESTGGLLANDPDT